MPLVNVWECEECEKLEKGSSDPTGDRAPDGWIDVGINIVGTDGSEPNAPPSLLFCSMKCVGLHFRPIQRRKANGDEAEEDHSAT